MQVMPQFLSLFPPQSHSHRPFSAHRWEERGREREKKPSHPGFEVHEGRRSLGRTNRHTPRFQTHCERKEEVESRRTATEADTRRGVQLHSHGSRVDVITPPLSCHVAEEEFSDPDEGCMRQTYEMDPPWETFQSRRTKDERCMLRVNVTHVQSNPHAEEIEPTSSTWREGNTHLCQRVDDASIEMESHLGTQPPRKTCGHCTSSRETNLCPPKAWMRRQKINFKFPKVHHSQHVQPKRAQLIQRIQ